MKTESTAARACPERAGTATGTELLLAAAMLIKGTYVSWDEVERADAFEMGYDAVCQHPIEVGVLGADDELVIDGNNILFGDFDAAVRVALEALRNGAAVGVHTYHPDDSRLAPLLSQPGVTVAKTHRELRAAMRRPRSAAPVRPLPVTSPGEDHDDVAVTETAGGRTTGAAGS